MASPDLDGFKLDMSSITSITKYEKLVTLEDNPAKKETNKSNSAPLNTNKSSNKRAVSDDESSRGGKKLPKLRRGKKKPMEIISTEKSAWTKAAEKSIFTMEDFRNTIDDAVREQRIDEKKTERLHECLQSGDWSEVAYSLLCEQIPLKRRGKGYSCRVCLVPKKGHTCQYCHICSTPEDKYKKDDDHVCANCPICFEEGKKKKKLIQVKREGHVCPHGGPSRDK